VTVVVVLVLVGSAAEFGLGVAVGRRLPRGRHSKPRRPWARQRWEAIAAARQSHPTAHDDNVVIDLRAWIPKEEHYDPAARRSALVGRGAAGHSTG
jgi:hypothetical protein